MAAANSPLQSEGQRETPAGPVRTMSFTLDRIEEESRALQRGARDRSLGRRARSRIASTPLRFAIDCLTQTIRSFEALKEIAARARPGSADSGAPSSSARRALSGRLRPSPAEGDAGARPEGEGRRARCSTIASCHRSGHREFGAARSFLHRARDLREGAGSRGLRRPMIMAALSTDKTELSKMISVARAVPESIAHRDRPGPEGGPAALAATRRTAQSAESCAARWS